MGAGFYRKRRIFIGALLILLTSFFYGCQQQETNKKNDDVAQIMVSKGGAHGYIKDANELVITDKNSEGYNLEAVRFIDDSTLLIVRSNKVDYKYYVCYLDKGIVKPLPDILKNADIYLFNQVLQNGNMFFKLTSTSENSGEANDYVIIDGNTLEVKKKIDAPDGVDSFISISPDEKSLVYQKGQNLYSSDLDFKNEVLLVKAKIIPEDETLNEVPRYGVFYNNNMILYRLLGYEWINNCATVDKDGKNKRILPNSYGMVLQVTNRLDKYLYDDLNNFEYGVYDSKTGVKNAVFKNKDGGIIAYTFNKDLNYFVVCFTEDLNKNTGSKVEIYSLNDFNKIVEFTNKDAHMYPVSLSASPSGTQMAFLDEDANGDWKIYIMNMSKYN